jgi:tRNA(adenine34) deaminase
MSGQDLHFMQLALEQARSALAHDDIPVGAVLVRDGQVIGKGKNERELIPSPTAHAEVQAVNDAARAHGHWNLTGTRLYVTLEPCPMCAGALVLARVDEVIYGAKDPKGGALSLGINILENSQLNHRLKVRQGPLAEECAGLLKDFFRRKRGQKKTPSP